MLEGAEQLRAELESLLEDDDYRERALLVAALGLVLAEALADWLEPRQPETARALRFLTGG